MHGYAREATIDLKHALHVRFGALEGIQIAHKDARVDRLRILRVGLVGQFGQLHGGYWQRHRSCQGHGHGRSRVAPVFKEQERNPGENPVVVPVFDAGFSPFFFVCG